MRIAKRAGMKKAKVALARKLAVIMHRDARQWHDVHDPASVATVLGTIKDKPSVAKWPSLTAPARDAPQVSGRDEGIAAAAVEQRNVTSGEG